MIGSARYFPGRYFAPRYWPKLGAEIVLHPPQAVGVVFAGSRVDPSAAGSRVDVPALSIVWRDPPG